MTESDSLRGDPNHDPTRRHHPELRELDTLRALLRPRMTATGDSSPTEALRGLIVELEGVTGQANLLHERVKVLEADLEAANNRVADLEVRLRREREQDHAGAQAVADRLRELMSTCFDGSRGGDIYVQLAEMEKWIPKFTSEWKANHERWLHLCGAYGLAEPHRSLDDVLSHLAKLAPMETVVGQQAIHTRLCDLLCGIQGGHNGGTTQELFDELASAVKEMGKNVLAERKLAVAAAEGHDHCRELLVAACSTLGSADYDNLPHLVAALLEQLNTSNGRAERLQASIDEMDKTRVLRAAETAVERKALEDRIVALRSTPEAINRSQEFALFEAHVRQEESERAAADRQEVRNEFAADIAALNDAIEAGHAKVARLHGRISELDNERVQLTTAIGNAAKEVGVLCEGRAAVDILPDLLANTKHKVAFAAEYATERVQAHIEHAKGRVAEAEAALALLGWTDSYNMMVWARSIAQPVAAARWTKICEAFGFDPEEDPPASIPAILAGDRWTNTRRMLADACAKLRAPSLEVILGELINAVTKAQGVSTDVLFGRAPVPSPAPLSSSVQAPIELPCPKLDEPCHVRKSPEPGLLDVAPQVWIVEPVALPGYVISGRNASWMWKAKLGNTNYALAGYGSATAAIAGAREHVEMMKRLAKDNADSELVGLREALDEAANLARERREKIEVMEAQLKAADLDTTEIEAVREALGVPAGKPLLPYVHHAAKGMQALAILGWQDGHPVEWATKRAAAEADLRGAFAEAELVGNDHAAMVRQLWGNLRSASAQHVDAIARLHALSDSVRELDSRLVHTVRECTNLRAALAERNARVHQLEIDNSKVHLEGRIELAEKRIAYFRAWLLGMCPAPARDKFGTIIDHPGEQTDDALIASIQFVPRSDYDKARQALIAIASIFAAINDLPA